MTLATVTIILIALALFIPFAVLEYLARYAAARHTTAHRPGSGR